MHVSITDESSAAEMHIRRGDSGLIGSRCTYMHKILSVILLNLIETDVSCWSWESWPSVLPR